MTLNWEDTREAKGERRATERGTAAGRGRLEKTDDGKSGRRKTRSGQSGLAETGFSEKPARCGGLVLDSGGREARKRDEGNIRRVDAGHHWVRGTTRRKGAGGTAGKRDFDGLGEGACRRGRDAQHVTFSF